MSEINTGVVVAKAWISEDERSSGRGNASTVEAVAVAVAVSRVSPGSSISSVRGERLKPKQVSSSRMG